MGSHHLVRELREARHRLAIPLRRLGQPHDIVACAMYLASDEAAYVTAANFVVDGGVAGTRGVAMLPRSDKAPS
jgi:NAD(P)-dependent dehydrogenase (short-subunit alcohol dehydrogenase family)